ncbi:helix-turn-helix domain-containing protein [Achromobacter sp. AONIH1]|jgi:AraC family transcriptional regulator|uniref:helix-turn-helix domain-containing protein n=1 Tax=Achromobacter sp. AONIH1 TaxID=1758194 RepID=UPI000CD0B217|nr:AraC family transcriptional regulator [Achromobacter sp. AONIH1]AUT45528.1 AraC family transcriptional regulator [Achromobacter sp. AONIH1]
MGTVASAPADFSVFRTLSGSTATLERAATLGEGLAISQWSRSARETLGYDMPGHHTLSLYLRGGEKSFRVGLDSLHGGAGKFCVLPAEHYSRWSMNDNVRFLHLYIAPERLAREAVMRLDCEPRSLELRDRTYIHDDSLTDVCRSLLGTDWSRPDERLAASSAAETVLHQLLHQGVSRKTPQPARGGLAPAVRRRVMDYVDAHLDAPLTLAELAGVAALSTYHFARMFHTSFGEPPHAWVRARRIERAKALLAAGKSDLAGIAQASGFGSASHLSRVFRDAAGVTPGQYRGARAGR